MKLILVRHGETDRNKNKHHLHQGPVTLNATGRQQGEAVAVRLKDEPIDVIISSDLPRAQETADIIAGQHAQVKRLSDHDLRERDAGIFATRTVAEREASQRASGLSFRDWRPEGGESMRDVKRRAMIWFEKFRSQSLYKTVLVVSHGFFLYSLLEVAVEGGADVEREEYSMSNCGVTILEIPREGLALVVNLNDTSHLGDIPSLPSAVRSAIKEKE